MEARKKPKGAAGKPLYCLVVFSLVTGAVTVIRGLELSIGSVLIPTLWGLGAVLPPHSGERDLLSFGLTGSRLKVNAQYFVLSSLVVFPLYAIGFLFYAHGGFHVPVPTSFEGVAIPHWLFYNFLAVALFEELFFRGYVQGNFVNWSNARLSGSGALFWIPIVISAFLFALAHVAVYLDPFKVAVFFPGILFGWLRAKTGSLLAPILSHGTANLVSMLLIGSVS